MICVQLTARMLLAVYYYAINMLLFRCFLDSTIIVEFTINNCNEKIRRKHRKMNNNVTNGVLNRIIAFSLPYLASCFMQTLYGMADLFIIGQFNGVESTTAVSIGSQVMHMLTVMIVGMTMGLTVLIGKSVGANNKKFTSKIIGNTFTLFAVLGVGLTVVLLFLVKFIVSVMLTPVEAVTDTINYLKICFIGVPFITAYNVISSIFRGKGDSKTPMYFVAIACVANITLDYLFIGGLNMGAVGAALGTTMSQAISVCISIIVIVKKNMGISINRSDLKPRKTVVSELLKVGVPVSLQDGFIQISFLIITIFANLRGLEDAAAVGIVEKIIAILFLVPSAMLSTVSALSAHYIGAEKYDLANVTLRYAIILSVSFGALSVLLMQFFAESTVGLFTEDNTVIIMGGQYMRGYVWDCILAGIHFCFSGYFCACRKSGISFAHNFVSILFARIPLSYLASKYFPNTLLPMGFASSLGSCISVLICIIAFRRICKNKENIRYT